MVATLCGSVIEIIICHEYAIGYVDAGPSTPGQKVFYNSFCHVTWITCVQGALAKHLREPHFWLTHRIMHPWRIRGLSTRYDPGHYLYKYVHSLHHKSHNPTAFSGTNMHVIEALLYYSAAFVPPILFKSCGYCCHPAIPLATLIDCGMAAWLGHDGFQWPVGSGDYYHLLHHQHFDCNYGTPNVPLDKWFGTYAGCKSDMKKIWGSSGKPFRDDGNEAISHPQSTSNHVE